MHKKYVIAAALASLLGLAACSGKPANEQAAEDAQKINLDAAVPNMAIALAANCAQSGSAAGCATDKVRGFVKSYPSFTQAIEEYSKKCPETYGAKMCAEGYSGFLADNVADKLVTPVVERAKEILQEKAAAARKTAEAQAAAAKKIAEEAAQKAREAAAEAARRVAEEAKQAEEAVKNSAADAAKAAGNAAQSEGKGNAAAPAAPHPQNSAKPAAE